MSPAQQQRAPPWTWVLPPARPGNESSSKATGAMEGTMLLFFFCCFFFYHGQSWCCSFTFNAYLGCNLHLQRRGDENHMIDWITIREETRCLAWSGTDPDCRVLLDWRDPELLVVFCFVFLRYLHMNGGSLKTWLANVTLIWMAG